MQFSPFKLRIPFSAVRQWYGSGSGDRKTLEHRKTRGPDSFLTVPQRHAALLQNSLTALRNGNQTKQRQTNETTTPQWRRAEPSYF